MFICLLRRIIDIYTAPPTSRPHAYHIAKFRVGILPETKTVSNANSDRTCVFGGRRWLLDHRGFHTRVHVALTGTSRYRAKQAFKTNQNHPTHYLSTIDPIRLYCTCHVFSRGPIFNK